mmetsp:Transcript_11237/g.33930  ORF Transcript_11237/g.33930 Transcript_11237/m.33930 type:complete len:355 (-) Transcript_11237:162-1226(-)
MRPSSRRLLLVACAVAAASRRTRTSDRICWNDRDVVDAKPLFWLHAPKTGSSLRRHLADYACPLPPDRPKFANAHLARERMRHCARACEAENRTQCARPFHLESLLYHKSLSNCRCASLQSDRCRRCTGGGAGRQSEGYRGQPARDGCVWAGAGLFRDARERLVSAFHYNEKQKQKKCSLMGVTKTQNPAMIKIADAECRRVRGLPLNEGVRAYAALPSARNVQTKMLLGLYRYAGVPDDKLDVKEATRRLRLCFPFVGLLDRYNESLWLFARTMRGARDIPPHLAVVNSRPGTYDKLASGVEYLADFADADVAVYAEAKRLFEERLAAARRGRGCKDFRREVGGRAHQGALSN